ncbi:hypothetical protein FRAHR75_1310012 [Frankia sp. Hr75.2]|nr:hypothetical protein FRAHR75_1310012 [Frankia sp. Hr75.2]
MNPDRSSGNFGRWRDDGTTETVHDLLRWLVREHHRRKADPSAVVLDSQTVRSSTNAPKDTTGLDPGKRSPGRKRGIAVDTLGLLIAVVVVAASVHDNTIGTALLDRVAAGAQGVGGRRVQTAGGRPRRRPGDRRGDRRPAARDAGVHGATEAKELRIHRGPRHSVSVPEQYANPTGWCTGTGWKLGRVNGMPRPGRPTWTPSADEQRALDELAELAAAADAAEAAVWAAARAARRRGVPVDRVAAVLRRGRMTVYRHLDEGPPTPT